MDVGGVDGSVKLRLKVPDASPPESLSAGFPIHHNYLFLESKHTKASQ